MKKISERRRIQEIVSVFVSHGIKKGKISPSDARSALEELGSTFVKFGQILSTRPDMVPDEYIKEFEKLQDCVQPEAYNEIEKIIQKEWGKRIDEVLGYIDPKPIASASMAQVHLAQTKQGEQVVVKVQRPHIKEIMLTDLSLLKKIARLGKVVPQKSVVDFKEVIEEISNTMEKELDFLNEAKNIEKFYTNNKNVPYVVVPKVYKKYTTSSVIVMEYLKGIKISDRSSLKEHKYDLKDIGKKLAKHYAKQIFEDGFFHADPHPGNLLIVERKIGYVDFGMMGVLSKSMQNKLNHLLYAVAKRDVEQMTQAILRLGIKKGKVRIPNLYSDVEQVYNRYIQESIQDIALPRFMEEIFQVSKKNNIAMPTDMTMFLKGLMTLEGVLISLDPNMNLMDIAIPFIKEHILFQRNYKQDFIDQVDNLYQLYKYGFKIPVKTLELINSMLAGKIKIQLEHINLEESIHQLNKMTNRIVAALIISSIVIGSSLVIKANVGPKIYNISSFGLIGYVSAAFMGIVLLISILRQEKM